MMTPEKIAKIRHQAAVTFLQKLWEGTAQLGLIAAADAAQAQAELAELKSSAADSPSPVTEPTKEPQP